MGKLLEALKERNKRAEEVPSNERNNPLGFLRRRNAELKAREEREKLLRYLERRH